MSATYESVLKTYKQAGQEHVFTFYDSLKADEQAALVSQAASIDPLRVNTFYTNATTAPSHDASLDEIKPPPAEMVGTAIGDAEAGAKWEELGLAAIKEGSVGVLLLAGGQGTRLGSSAPKGCYDVDLPSHKSLFQLQAERVKKIGELAGANQGVPWYVMTSGPTRKETEEFFRTNGYFGLDEKNVIFFEQGAFVPPLARARSVLTSCRRTVLSPGVLPCLSLDGKILLSTPSTIATAPDGNGGIYAALRAPLSPSSETTVLSDLAARGVKYIHAYCVDNCLVRIADPIFLGYCISRESTCGAKVVVKEDPHESVGVLALKGGKVGVVEYSEIPRELSERVGAGGKLEMRAGNIVNHFYSLEFLNSVASFEDKMAHHVANKKIPYTDLTTGEIIKPAKPNGMKLELFIFDVFPFVPLPKFSILEVPRATDFSPLKNAPNTGSDDPQTSRRDLLAENARWLKEAGATLAEGVEVEIAASVSLLGERLETVKGKTFTKSGYVEKVADFEKLV
ncbi:UDP-N-acetylglucosamine pyrophosphorylase [Pseudohyphozyma bogoriensis]|nr:UDP-N-acetylglucosamine pyrophosphorylase [Pseudohyphozyma bogoriensis]